MTDSGRQWQKWVVCLLLGAAVMIAFWPALGCNFVYFDDQDYVLFNKNIQHGVHWDSLKWALTSAHAANWHPLTWVSHMLDVQIYGLEPAGHHMTSLLLHAGNAIMLFLLLNGMTGAFWRSAFVAAMFAVHPLRVESVVWVSERKDVLSTFFCLLTVAAYVRYAQEFQIQSAFGRAKKSSKVKAFYVLALALFACALMSKPMAVTLPFVLLLLDYWPLGRLGSEQVFSWRLVVEKIPFLLLAAADSVVTFLIQNHFGVVTTLTRFPLGIRLANIPVAYLKYLSKNFWPTGLAVFYPHHPLGILVVAAAVGALLGISFLVVKVRRTRPYLLVGWFWFLGILVPAIGLVQVSTQAMADRYSYLPSVGLWIMLAWGVNDLVGNRLLPRATAALAGGLAIIVCMIGTSVQAGYWQNTRALFMRAAKVTDQNYLAYYNLGCYAKDSGDYAQAILDFKKALAAEADNAPWANHARAYNNLGYAYLQQGNITDAVADFEKAVELQPIYPEAYYNLGRAFQANNQPDVAVEAFQRALALDPNVAEIHFKMANALLQLGKPAEAISQYSQALQINPGLDDAANNLAWLLATCPDHSLRDGAKAVALARRASDHAHNQNPVILGTLAAAYAEVGQFSEAAAVAQQASQLALAQKNSALAGALESQGHRYQSGLGGSPP